MADNKRPQDGVLVPVNKRPRQEIVPAGPGASVLSLVTAGPPRTSSLLAPVMQLSGHEGEVFTARFSPKGNVLASAGFDRQIFLWNTLGDCENFSVLPGHTGAVLQLDWSPDGSSIYSVSSDQNCFVWDAEAGLRVRRLRGHTGIVNACNAARQGDPLLVSGSDDRTIKVWDTRNRHAVHSLNSKFQVTAVSFNGRADQIVSGGLENDIKVWDLRKLDVLFTMKGHTDTITGLSLSPNGTQILSNSMDNSVRMWDIQPFVAGNRLQKAFYGAQHNFEKNLIKCAWSADGKLVLSGSADRNVYIWNSVTTELQYCLPGHKGSVNDVHFHPTEPIVLSASSDKKLFLGELV